MKSVYFKLIFKVNAFLKNIMDKQLYKQAIEGTAAAGILEILTPYIQYEKGVYIESVSLMNDDSSGKIIDIGIERGGIYFWIISVIMTTTKLYYRQELQVKLLPNERISVKGSSLGTTDTIKVIVIGEYL